MEIAAVIVGLLVIIGVPVVVVNRDLLFHRGAARRARVEPPLPFLIIPTSQGASDLVPSGIGRNRAATTPSTPSTTPIPDDEIDYGYEADDEVGDDAAPLSGAESRWMPPPPLADQDPDDEPDEVSPDATVIFHRPVDEPIQILPGRLQVISGESSREDLRFFGRMGEQPRIVVGRDAGPPHQHITLHSPTVSRRHARMDFENGAWTITNLSQTNPVLVNDRVLNNGGSARKLSDGDRIELGEVALRFRST
jgi:hypothetical protein